MDVHASLRNLRIAPRKVRLVVDTVRGLAAQTAETRLTFLQKGAAEPVLKLLRSAMANAEHNFQIAKDSLYIKHIVADAGSTIKRFRPRAFGRAATIRKRMTHVTIILAPKAEKIAAAQAKATAAQVGSASASAPAKRASKKSAASNKPAIKTSPDA